MNRTRSVLRLVVIATAVWPLAAMEVPQTRREFVKAVAAGEGATRMEKLVVERDFDEIYRLLAKKSATCLDVQVRRSGFVGNQMEVSSSDYNPTLARVGGNGFKKIVGSLKQWTAGEDVDSPKIK